MNPYASHLGSRDPIETIGKTADRLHSLIGAMAAERVNQPIAPGKWSPREIACHLADCELAFSFRLRQSLSEDGHVMQPFDQDRWAANYYGVRNRRRAGGIFSGARVESDAAAVIAGGGVHAEVEPSGTGGDDISTIVETMGGHDLNHLGQLEKAAG